MLNTMLRNSVGQKGGPPVGFEPTIERCLFSLSSVSPLYKEEPKRTTASYANQTAPEAEEKNKVESTSLNFYCSLHHSGRRSVFSLLCNGGYMRFRARSAQPSYGVVEEYTIVRESNGDPGRQGSYKTAFGKILEESF